jgi:hypothetical protein
MPFTTGELSNIANAALDYHIKGPAFAQSIQDKPLLKAFEGNKKTFPGGKGNITIPVKGDYTTAIAGYTHNDSVSYANPANIKRVTFPWREIHAGITVTLTELKNDGISVVDSAQGKNVSEHSERELTVLTGLLEDKLDDMTEGWSKTFNNMLWRDGTQDAKQVPGLLSILTDTPAVGTTGGLDRATTAWWRHRALVGANKITASTTNQTLSKTLRKEIRQLRRYAKNPNYLLLAGSAFLEALEGEVAEKGYYSMTGFANNGKNDIGMADISMRGVGSFVYDPTLDDLSLSKRAYFIDLNAIKLQVMEGEDKKTHNPARPYDQYSLYRAMTWTGGMTVQQLNSSAVYEVA